MLLGSNNRGGYILFVIKDKPKKMSAHTHAVYRAEGKYMATHIQQRTVRRQRAAHLAYPRRGTQARQHDTGALLLRKPHGKDQK